MNFHVRKKPYENRDKSTKTVKRDSRIYHYHKCFLTFNTVDTCTCSLYIFWPRTYLQTLIQDTFFIAVLMKSLMELIRQMSWYPTKVVACTCRPGYLRAHAKLILLGSHLMTNFVISNLDLGPILAGR